MVNGISSGSSGYYQQQQDYTSLLKDAGIPSDVISKGTSSIEEYAKENNITLPKKQTTQSNQTKQQGSIFKENANSEAPDITSELLSLGIPADIIAQGQSAVSQYAEENGLSLPEPPEKPNNVDSPQLNVTA